MHRTDLLDSLPQVAQPGRNAKGWKAGTLAAAGGRIPLEVTGTAVGVASVVSFLPDVYMGPVMGVLLDDHPGVRGHELVFLVLAGFAALGLLATLAFRRVVR